MSAETALITGAVGILTVGGAEFARKIAGKIADKIGDDIAEGASVAFQTYRIRNWAETQRRALAQVEAAQQEAKAIPPKVLVPLMGHSSLEDDPSMQERWASLLARAAVSGNADDVPPAYADILSQLTPLAATVLEVLKDTRASTTYNHDPGLYSHRIADDLAKALGGRWQYHDAAEMYVRAAEANAAVDLLIRQGLVARAPLFEKKKPSKRGNVEYPEQLELAGYGVHITELGRRFFAACQPLPAK
jgi:hypothetical protein